MKRLGWIGWAMSLVLVLAYTAAAVTAEAAPNVKEKGVLEAVGDNGRSAVISTRAASVDKTLLEHRGTYQVSSYAVISDGFGRKVALTDITLPAKIEFEVEYTAEGPVIKKVRVLPQ